MDRDNKAEAQSDRSESPLQEINNYLHDLKNWFHQNSHTLICEFAKDLTLFTTTSVLLGWLFIHFTGGQLVENIAAYDVASRIEHGQQSSEYLDDIQKVPEELRNASVEVNLPGFCTATVLDKIGDIYTAILASHCFPNKEDEIQLAPGDNIFVGLSPDGVNPIKTTHGFELVKFAKVDGQDIGFIAFAGYRDTKIEFSPYGNRLSAFDSNIDKSLTGFSYPFAADGWPIPISGLSTENGRLEPSSRFSIPVARFPTSPAGSGTSLINEEGKVVAIQSKVKLDILDLSNYDRKTVLSPVTSETIHSYDNFVKQLGRP